jgi:hypothetical protein
MYAVVVDRLRSAFTAVPLTHRGLGSPVVIAHKHDVPLGATVWIHRGRFVAGPNAVRIRTGSSRACARGESAFYDQYNST